LPGNNSIEEWAAKSAEGQAANLEATDAARHLGALAFYDNTNQALAAYRKAVGLEAGNPDGWNQLGHLLVRIGELKDAEEVYGKVKAIAESLSDRQWLAIAYGNLGIVYQTRGALAQAEEIHKKALAIFEALSHKVLPPFTSVWKITWIFP
jgi:tetratricopeptide (TPR) repeat protein